MSSHTPSNRPIPEIQRSQDTPASRVEWHLACLEARGLGLPLPPPPWETQETSALKNPRPPSSTLKTLAVPLPRSLPVGSHQGAKERRAPKDSPTQNKRHGALKTGPEDVLSRKPLAHPELKPSSQKPVESKQSNPLSSATLPPRPAHSPHALDPRTIQVSLLNEKKVIIASLLLRAGVPAEIIQRDNRDLAVLEHFTSYLRAPMAQTLHKYDLGRQFITRGDVTVANKAADIVIPVLRADTKRELSIRTTEAELELQTKILPLNIPSSKSGELKTRPS